MKIKMFKQMAIGVGATLVLILIFAGFKKMQIDETAEEAAKRQLPPTAVTSAIAQDVAWSVSLNAVGELAPIQGTMLAAEESGRVTAINFKPGAVVEGDTVLLELDTSVEEAELKGARATYQLAKLELSRHETLRKNSANAVSDLDRARAEYRAAEAAVASLEAKIAKKKVIAPFRGKTGLRHVNLGQVLAPGTNVVSLQDLEKLYLNFTLPQKYISKLAIGLTVSFTVDAFGDRTFQGTLTTIEPAVDEASRNIELQAVVNNEDGALLPGMFARVELLLNESMNVVSIPTSGVSFSSYENAVFVITKKSEDDTTGVVKRTPVVLGERRGELIAVTSGLKGGEEVVSSAAFQLRDGAPILINNTVVPGSSISPSPSDT